MNKFFVKFSVIFVLLSVTVFSGYGQAYDASKDIHHYMMDKKDKHKLPTVPGRTYISSDEKIAVISGNSIKAVTDGDCDIYALVDGQQSVFARVTVGWQVQNPVLPYSWDLNIPDCEAHAFNGKLYIYGSVDASNVFCSPYLIPVVTADLKRWESHGVAFSSFNDSLPYPKRMLWGSDVHFYNGKYLLYGAFEWFGGRSKDRSYVLESDNPMGPFKNFRWVTGNPSKKEIDGITAKVFVEKDGSRYIIWAPTAQPVHENHLLIARLIENDVIDESSIKKIEGLKDFYEGPSIRKRGDIYYLIYNENCGAITDKNHTPKRFSYATSKNITGEYVYRGVILTIEDIPGNTNIQGSIEEFNGKWYAFYHRALNGVWNRRALCIEKIEFDRDGLIKPIVPTSSGIAEGLDTSKPIYFNTAVIQKNCRFSNDGKYGSAVVRDSAETGFRYVALTGKEKKISLQGEGLNNIIKVTVTANGKIIGQGIGGQDIKLENVRKGKAELVLNITANGEVKLETLCFF
ncbi:MAG: family 43 glycosylhydrolase [Tannerellaceae bacterium]|jgi:hypothetical protein|nr:family 43 glycosylhydrolase [Tannerellaceae bacterium]